MTTVNIELEIEQVEAIVVSELQRQYGSLNYEVGILLEREATGTLPPHKVEDLRDNTRHLNNIEGVLRFYMSHSDFEAWITSFDFPGDDDDEGDADAPVVAVTDIVEHEDGSATYTFDMSPDTVAAFAKIGLRSALIEAAEKCCQNSNHDVTKPHDD